jgi:SAM-dependent methyltransferase
MDTLELQQHWDQLAKDDAMWAILTHKRKGSWSADEFFADGRREIAELFACPIIGEARRFRHGLDFGCGIGRLTQALAARCDRVTGVDIAPTMVATARTLNVAGARCEYIVNKDNNLELFADESFDFIYSNIVLQHMSPALSAGYILEFVRLLAPQGLLVFQIPSRPARTLIGMALRVAPVAAVRWLRQMDMYGTPRERVLAMLRQAGATVLETKPDASAGPHWESFRYFCTK